MSLIYERSIPGRRGHAIPDCDVQSGVDFPRQFRRAVAPALPEVSELDVVRHFSNLSRRNFSVDTNFYPLGSCTMKYNTKIAEKIAQLDGFVHIHPLLPQLLGGGMLAQGAMEVLYRAEKFLCEITGMRSFTMQPLAGAHGELTGVMLIAAYHKRKGEKRKYILVPDSSHGTNPASAAIAGYEVLVIPSGSAGCMDLATLKKHLTPDVAAVMMTCPNTLGLFNSQIGEICRAAHAVDALMYYDGANLNAIMGKARPGDIGFDVMHVNLHKTFATPHGGGGPGAGPVGVTEKLADFLPIPRVAKRSDGSFALHYQEPLSIGFVAPFYGNFNVILKSFVYMVLLGKSGLQQVSEYAVLNANYCMELLKQWYDMAFDRRCMHEFVVSAEKQKAAGVSALDIAKYLIDQGIHPPTVYFPLIVKEALMIEPTETESPEVIDRFVAVMGEIAELVKSDPQKLRDAPVTMPVKRLDEAKAARDLKLRWQPAGEKQN
ncbi:MAG: aminomethyl-transferring glycine dehydrogenase subunit GcvPB [Candidatus Omnitrophica bacterium]|nr:aminomethyl-transferring glycine dehydrogenase subunit GcvPB [Candidatus Omnitrophota bacterium]